MEKRWSHVRFTRDQSLRCRPGRVLVYYGDVEATHKCTTDRGLLEKGCRSWLLDLAEPSTWAKPELVKVPT